MNAENRAERKGLTCRDALDVLMDYLDGALPAGELARMNDHLSICTSCRNYLQSYVQTVQLATSGLGKPGPPPPPLSEELLEYIRQTLDTKG